MKLLVTGAAGFIGSHTCEALVARGHEVVGMDSFDDFLYPSQVKRKNAATLGENLPVARFRLVEGDICDAEALGALVESEAPDVVCHLAAVAGVRPSLEEPLRYMRVNVHGTTAVLEACRQGGVDHLVFASSSSVYGVRATGDDDLREVAAFREDDPCLFPASPYAASKRAAELVCSTYRDLYGIGASALRFFTVYGPRQRPDMAIHKFVQRIALGERITLYGDGSSRRDYTFIDDIVAGTVSACERVELGAYRVYNLGGTHTVSLSELIAAIEGIVGKRAVVEHVPMPPGDVPVTYADITASARDLDYRPETDLEHGLARFYEWFRGA